MYINAHKPGRSACPVHKFTKRAADGMIFE